MRLDQKRATPHFVALVEPLFRGVAMLDDHLILLWALMGLPSCVAARAAASNMTTAPRTSQLHLRLLVLVTWLIIVVSLAIIAWSLFWR